VRRRNTICPRTVIRQNRVRALCWVLMFPSRSSAATRGKGTRCGGPIGNQPRVREICGLVADWKVTEWSRGLEDFQIFGKSICARCGSLLSHPETGRTHDSVCTRHAVQQSPPMEACALQGPLCTRRSSRGLRYWAGPQAGANASRPNADTWDNCPVPFTGTESVQIPRGFVSPAKPT
jgi:hypothetical protein